MRSARETLRPLPCPIGTKAGAESLFDMANETLPATAFKSPAIALSGVVDYEMYTKFRTHFDNASDQSIVSYRQFLVTAGPVRRRRFRAEGRLAWR
jgi:hypothetical protein